jgi:tetratricopeptide (TPR) repeat protein
MLHGIPAMIRRSLVVLVLGCLGHPAVAQVVAGCGDLSNAYGPFDYRDPVVRAERLPIVESNHFTPQVEALTSGQSGALEADISYTLRAFPNHPRALNAAGRFALKGGRFSSPVIPTADCFFKRAIQFRQDDYVVRMVFANYLSKRGDKNSAQEQYEEALRLAPEDPEVNYNAGLFFVERGDLVRAKQAADVAYGGGYPLPGLRKKIQAAESRAKP